MKKYAFIDPSTGEILNIRMPYVVPEEWQDNAIIEGMIVKKLDADINNSAWISEKIWSGSEWITKPAKPSERHKWTSTGWVEVINQEDEWLRIRFERQNLLFNSDWTQTSDSPLTDAKKEEWRVYRQALRDVTTAQSSVQKYEDIVWPTEPT